MKAASRLLVLVEDTTATRDLWGVWRQKALEPVLEKIGSAAFGVYEMNLVVFASVDGQSDGLLRSGNWTRSVTRFRQYFESLTFEGCASLSGLGEALVEATYLTRQPSTLGRLENIAQHILLCATSSVGRLPVLWPFREQDTNSADDPRISAMTIMAHLITSYGLTVSILTERKSTGALAKTFERLAGERALKNCEEMSKGRDFLTLIHPRWRHGLQALFPECKEMEEWRGLPLASDSDCSSKNSPFLSHYPCSPPPKTTMKLPEAALDALLPCSANYAEVSLKMQQEFPDAVHLPSWSKPEEFKISWNEKSQEETAETSSLEQELALECDLLRLETKTERDRELCSEKESKLDSSTSYGCAASPAYSSTKQSAPTTDPPEMGDPFASNAAQSVCVTPEEHSSSVFSQRIAIASQRSKTMSSSASVTIEPRRKSEEGLKRPLQGLSCLMEAGPQPIGHQSSWPQPRVSEPRRGLSSSHSYTRRESGVSYRAQGRVSYLSARNLKGQGSVVRAQDAHDAKRIRAAYHPGPAKHPAFQVSHTYQSVDHEDLSSLVYTQQHKPSWGIVEPPKQPSPAPMPTTPPRTSSPPLE